MTWQIPSSSMILWFHCEILEHMWKYKGVAMDNGHGLFRIMFGSTEINFGTSSWDKMFSYGPLRNSISAPQKLIRYIWLTKRGWEKTNQIFVRMVPRPLYNYAWQYNVLIWRINCFLSMNILHSDVILQCFYSCLHIQATNLVGFFNYALWGNWQNVLGGHLPQRIFVFELEFRNYFDLPLLGKDVV